MAEQPYANITSPPVSRMSEDEYQAELYNISIDVRALRKANEKIEAKSEQASRKDMGEPKALAKTIREQLQYVSQVEQSATSKEFRKLKKEFQRQIQKFNDLNHAIKAAKPKTSKKGKAKSRKSPAPTPAEAAYHPEYTEEQFMAQVAITTYENEDERSTEAVSHVTNQITQINAAYQEIGNLVAAQNENVEALEANTAATKEHVEQAYSKLAEADGKAKYCNLSKRKLCCMGVVVVLVLLVVMTLIISMK